ncbi:MAG: Uncharacterized protein FD162_3095 [Rhodobacteraceae bacterium]|uniref:hypothetical protein n=1 Tax=Cypionkella sp. TaxID=2811411 RepID=UPI00132C914D|nr:hypothetical protein [Cypionkella sp.]KAF0171275.1 MAG: Uncharacterized protein FD162_3095 [Paracoccaceae bacterium]MDO8327057.1 hypothetical protein [Cypionkella sp.]
MIASSKPAEPPPRRVLYITKDLPSLMQGRDEVMVISFDGLTAACLATFRPDAVLFSLFSADEDATGILSRLHELGYVGDCLVMCPNLPKPRQIEAELRGIAPGIRVQLLMSDAPPLQTPPQSAGLSRL